MKKILIVIVTILVLTTGCSNVLNLKNASVDTIVDKTINSKYKLDNHINRGFKYYLPRELAVIKQDEQNEIIKYDEYDLYLYVDLISYYNKKDVNYEKNDNIYYSRVLLKDEKKGLVNIDVTSDEVYIKVTYNYATIETKINNEDINNVISNIMIILSSITYNDDVIENILASNSHLGKDEVVDVFDNKKNDNTYLDIEETEYTGNEEEDYDPDVIN